MNDHKVMEKLDELEASLALMMRILTRLETRVCKLITHVGAAHLIESR